MHLNLFVFQALKLGNLIFLKEKQQLFVSLLYWWINGGVGIGNRQFLKEQKFLSFYHK